MSPAECLSAAEGDARGASMDDNAPRTRRPMQKGGPRIGHRAAGRGADRQAGPVGRMVLQQESKPTADEDRLADKQAEGRRPIGR